MPATTPGGHTYVLPADHPLEYPATSQTIALKADSDRIYRATKTAACDSNGKVYLNAAEMGMPANPVGAIASLQYSSSASGTAQFATAMVANGSVNVRIWKTAASGGTLALAGPADTVTVYVIAW